MEKVIKKRMDILSILVKRLGDTVGKEAYTKIFKIKDQKPTDGEVIIKK
jgi:hypothetical protein